MAQLFLKNALGYLDSAEADSAGEVALASCCYALELILKSYLLGRGFTDAWNAEHLGHDLSKAHALAVRHGLPDDDARIDQLIREVNVAVASHDLMRLHAERPGLVARYEAVIALRSLHRAAERRQ